MRLSTISNLYGGAGPWASVYLDATGNERTGTPVEARQELEKRWRAAREALQRKGADEPTLRAIDDAVRSAPPVVGPAEVAVLASQGAVAVTRTLPVAPGRETADWSAQPHAADLLRALAAVASPAAAGPQFAASERSATGAAALDDAVRWVLADVDRTGGAVTSFDGHRASVRGEDEYITKRTDSARDRWWSTPRHQHAAEANWDHNTKDMARLLQREIDRVGAEVVVLTGDVRARDMVLDRLPGAVADRVVLVDHEVPVRPHPESRVHERRQPDVSDAVLAGATRAAVDAAMADRRRQAVERFHSGLSTGDSVRGLGPVSEAAREQRIDTLVLSTEPSRRLAWVDPHNPMMVGESKRDTGVDAAVQEPADDAILGAAAAAGAESVVIEADPELVDGLGAILRFQDVDTPTYPRIGDHHPRESGESAQ